MDNNAPDPNTSSDLQSTSNSQRHTSYHGQNVDSTDQSGIPRLKRTACILCRRRKLRCDQIRPKCGTCERLGHDCQYDEGGRKKSGPKRGYVKALEARLAQVETMLKTQDMPDFNMSDGDVVRDVDLGISDPLPGPDLSQLTASEAQNRRQNTTTAHLISPKHSTSQANSPQRHSHATQGQDSGFQTDFSFDMIALGLEEPLPTPDIMDELNTLYFERAHMTLPMIHKARYYAAMDLAPNMRPPVCLRYAMWACAASISTKYEVHASHFYQRARKYLELDEMRGFGQAIITLSHCQTWVLVTMYEFKNMFFPRAWMSTGRATRLAQMLSLHRVDGTGLDVKQTMAPPRDWTEKEERRRTFWMAYWCDRCASIGTGWPMSLEEKDILTNLPANEDDFQASRPSKSPTLQAAIKSIDQDLSSSAGSTLMATLFGRNLTHLHRAEQDDNEEDLNGKFWQRHREIDNLLLKLTLSLPDHLRLPFGMMDPNVVFLNMCLHSSTICLHQAAIFKADKHRLPPHISSESKLRCIAAATEIASIMRSVCHMDSTAINPFTSFCLYVSARVFVQYLKARPGDQQSLSSLTFLLTAMHSMTRRAAITESFIVQLELDMDAAKVPNPYNATKAQEDDGSAMPYPVSNLFPKDGRAQQLDERNRMAQGAPGLSKGPAQAGCNSDTILFMDSSLNFGSSAISSSNGSANQYGSNGGQLNNVATMSMDRTRSGGANQFDEIFDGSDTTRFSGQIVEMDTSPDSSAMGAQAEPRSQSVDVARTDSATTGMTSPPMETSSATPDQPGNSRKASHGRTIALAGSVAAMTEQSSSSGQRIQRPFQQNSFFETYNHDTQQHTATHRSSNQSNPARHGGNMAHSHAFPPEDSFGFPPMSFNQQGELGGGWDQTAGMTPGTQAWNDIIDTMGTGTVLWEANTNGMNGLDSGSSR